MVEITASNELKFSEAELLSSLPEVLKFMKWKLEGSYLKDEDGVTVGVLGRDGTLLFIKEKRIERFMAMWARYFRRKEIVERMKDDETIDDYMKREITEVVRKVVRLVSVDPEAARSKDDLFLRWVETEAGLVLSRDERKRLRKALHYIPSIDRIERYLRNDENWKLKFGDPLSIWRSDDSEMFREIKEKVYREYFRKD